MSLAAYNERRLASRRRKLVGGKPPRTYVQMQRLAVEIALGTHRGESTRAMAERLGCSHVHCWRVARRYRNGLIPMFPRDEQALVALRDALDHPAPAPTTRLGTNVGFMPDSDGVPLTEPVRFRSGENRARCGLNSAGTGRHASDEPRETMTVDESIAETWREVDEWKRNNPHFSGRPRTLQEWQDLERRGRRRVLFSAPLR